VHVNDIVAGTMAAPGCAPGIYNLGTGRGTSLNALASMLTRKLAPQLTPRHAEAPPGELRYSIADISAARRALGYHPSHTLERDLDGAIGEIRARANAR
jgi:nucleoside-diphosphate-sugar epimerase